MLFERKAKCAHTLGPLLARSCSKFRSQTPHSTEATRCERIMCNASGGFLLSFAPRCCHKRRAERHTTPPTTVASTATASSPSSSWQALSAKSTLAWTHFRLYDLLLGYLPSSLSAANIHLILLVVSLGCYSNAINGDFVHDDLVAITGNPDVAGRTTLAQLAVNDFWGQPMADPRSHKSYRPLTVFTYR